MRLLHPFITLLYAGCCLVMVTGYVTESLESRLPPPFGLAAGLAVAVLAVVVPAVLLLGFARLEPLDEQEIRRVIWQDLFQYFVLFGVLPVIILVLWMAYAR
jgi:hypothetical protein